MKIYDKSTKELMHDFAEQELEPGQRFSRKDAIRWFTKHYPNIKNNTVGMHVEGMSVNSNRRRHHPTIKPNSGWDLFFKLGPSEFRLWDSEKDPGPRYKPELDAEFAENFIETNDSAEESAEDSNLGSRKFAFEKDLQNYLIENLEVFEPGLTLYEDEDGEFNGVEFPAGQRYIDILAVGKDNAYVVIETKVSRAYDRVVGQILRYIGWVKKNIAEGASVRGIIVASEISEDLILATTLVENIRLVEYTISFSLKSVDKK